MSPAALDRLARRAAGEAHAVLGLLSTPASHGQPYSSCCALHAAAVEAVVVRLHDIWARYCRRLVIASASGARTSSGALLGPVGHVARPADVLPVLRSRYAKPKPPWYEPRWADAAECVNAARLLGVANAADIAAALGATSSPAEPLRRVRNFVAHRSQDTAAKAAAHFALAPAGFDAAALMLQPAAGTTVLDLWGRSLITLAFAAAG